MNGNLQPFKVVPQFHHLPIVARTSSVATGPDTNPTLRPDPLHWLAGPSKRLRQLRMKPSRLPCSESLEVMFCITYNILYIYIYYILYTDFIGVTRGNAYSHNGHIVIRYSHIVVMYFGGVLHSSGCCFLAMRLGLMLWNRSSGVLGGRC